MSPSAAAEWQIRRGRFLQISGMVHWPKNLVHKEMAWAAADLSDLVRKFASTISIRDSIIYGSKLRKMQLGGTLLEEISLQYRTRGKFPSYITVNPFDSLCSSGGLIVLQECHWNVNRSSFCQSNKSECAKREGWREGRVTSRVHSKQNKSYFSL